MNTMLAAELARASTCKKPIAPRPQAARLTRRRPFNTLLITVAAALFATLFTMPPTGLVQADALSDIDRELLKELRHADEIELAPAKNVADKDGPQQDNPLIDLARQMRSVEHRIAKADSGKATQDGQKRIMDQLDTMIEQVRKSCCGGGKPGQKQCQGGTGERKKVAPSKKPRQGKKPGKGSSPGESTTGAKVEQPGPAGSRTDMEQMQTLMKRLWGELPQRDREQMLQYPVEQFLPEYEQMIEEYYKHLSREKE